MQRHWCGVLAAAWIVFNAASAAAGEATIHRDTYGVPHIYADTPVEGAYALGYAQAEDRLEDIYINVRIAVGRMAEVFGPEHVETDFIMRMVRNAAVCQEKWPEAEPVVRDMCAAFVDGVKAFVAEHPDEQPACALELEPWHCAAIGRAMILSWPLGLLMDELKRKSENPGFGSNGWAVAPARSADGCAILLTDPHLTWEGLAVFYECRVHAGELEMCGFCIAGSPVIALGHSAHVGWACTTGGPDTSDVYMLPVKKDLFGLPTQYQYEGKWRTARVRIISIPVAGQDRPVVKPAMYTLHGPIIEEPDLEKGVAYAGKTPYMDDLGLLGQSYAMVTAQDAGEFFDALAMNHLMEQNIIFAGREGAIGYARVGRTPIRPAGYDWSKPVPGHTSATQWQGLHPLEDLVHIMNPPQGYLQNCNISPANMMKDSPLTPDKYRDYIYHVSWDDQNPRGEHATRLLDEDARITEEEAKAITVNVYDIKSPAWQKALDAAVNTDAGANMLKDAETARAVTALAGWDCRFAKDSAPATLMWQWRLRSEKRVDTGRIAAEAELSAEEKQTLLETLREALAHLQATYGRWDVAWGDMHVVGRGGVYYPYGGADFGHGANLTETLRTVQGRELDDGSGRHVARMGCMSTMLMFFHEDGIESFSCVPWGQSGNPESPHYMDQGRELFSKRKLKPTWFSQEALKEHISETTVLKTP